ncbi:MAG: GAF domain-containing protein, partial [Spirochaetota bacterium]
GLKLFGIKINYKQNKLKVVVNVLKVIATVKWKVKDIEDLIHLPEIENTREKLVMSLFTNLLPPAYLSNPDLLVVLIMRQVLYGIKHGYTADSSYAFICNALVHAGALMNYESAKKYANLAFELIQRFPSKVIEGQTKFMYTNWIKIWMDDLKELKSLRDEVYKLTQASGNQLYYSYQVFYQPWQDFFISLPLHEVYQEAIKFEKFINERQDETVKQIAMLERHLVLNLQGKTTRWSSLDADFETEAFEEELYIKKMTQDNYQHGIHIYHIAKLISCYIFGDYETAYWHGKEGIVTAEASMGLLPIAIHCFFYTLAVLANYEKASVLQRVKYRKTLKINFFLLKKWAGSCPQNFKFFYLLCRAEYNRVLKKHSEAMQYYYLATEEAKTNHYFHFLALANELMGTYYLQKKEVKAAESHILEARHNYHKWGATAKVKQIDEKYPDLVKSTLAKIATETDVFYDEEKGTISITTSTGPASKTVKRSTTTKMFDFQSVFKASQSLSGEIQFDRLLEKLMLFLLENAGATRGVLLFNDAGELKIEASGELKHKNIQVLQSIPLKDTTEISTSVINYVMRTKENVVLVDAAKEGQFRNDIYIKQNQIQSLLCAPILNKGELSGIIYLENDLTNGAFTKDRVEILQILASQAAISIDNAKLYDNLEGRVKQRTKEIGDIMNNVEQGIFTINTDLTINPEYSQKVLSIFNRNDFGGKTFASIFPLALQQKIETFLTSLFQNRFMSEKMFQSINPLKQYKLELGENRVRHLSFHFSRICKEGENGGKKQQVDKLMVVINDKTEEYQLQLQLQQKAEEQTNKVEKLYQILNLQPSIFTGFLQEGSEVIAIIRGKLSGGLEKLQDRKNLEEAYRAVHTLKGNARALNLDSIGQVCHKLEDELDKVRHNPEGIGEKLYHLVQEGIDKVDRELQDGNSLFDKVLGMKSALQSKENSPVATLESLLRNIVQKESEEQNKSLDFSFRADLTEPIRESRLKVLKNPLLQIVRNALGHGLEVPEIRRQLGKPERGKVRIVLQEREGKLVALCEDDGRGLDADKLRQKAVEKKLITALQAKALADGDCYQLIFLPGFSTAEKVTATSGRGVGMDIVKTEVEEAGGSIRIESSQGKFTRFIISV